MNEFTNPAGNLGNNPFLQAPSTILPMKGKSSETGLAASISRPKSMISGTRNRFDRYTAQQRMASADILNAHLLMVEIMMTNITQKYIYEVVSCLKERGLMRHNMKRRANELVNLSTDLMKRCNAHDAMQVRTFTETIHPGLSGSFMRGGGTLTQKLQNIFWKTYGEKINLIYFATKNALDKCNVRQSDLVSNMEMVAMMCTTGIEFYDCMCRKVDGLLNGVGKVNRQKSQHNEKMMAAVKDMLREMVEAQQEAELASTEQTEEMKLAIKAKYNTKIDELATAHEQDIINKQQEAMRIRFETEIAQAYDNEEKILRIRMEQKKAELDNLQQMEGESIEAFNLRKLEAQNAYLESKKELSDKEIEIEQAKYEAMEQVTNGLVALTEQIGESDRGFAMASKMLALAEIAINSGKAIAKMVSAESGKGILGIATMASGIATILSNIANAVKIVKSAKFAEGGLVTGPGTGTSDSIPAQLSNGESVITAKATSMFAPILSSFNMMGGGVPINVTSTNNQTLGEDMLARAVAKGMMMAPAPVVSVEEFTSVANRIKYIEESGSL